MVRFIQYTACSLWMARRRVLAAQSNASWEKQTSFGVPVLCTTEVFVNLWSNAQSVVVVPFSFCHRVCCRLGTLETLSCVAVRSFQTSLCGVRAVYQEKSSFSPGLLLIP